MWSFRSYLKAKCADPAFLEQYEEGCTICPQTVAMFNIIRERGLSFEQVAEQSGVLLENVELLSTAERCCYDDIRSIARCLNYPLSGVCRKADRKKE